MLSLQPVQYLELFLQWFPQLVFLLTHRFNELSVKGGQIL